MSRPTSPARSGPAPPSSPDGPAFVLERWHGAGAGTLKAGGRRLWLVPLAGAGSIGGAPLEAGGVWLVDGDTDLTLAEGTDMLVAYSGQGAIEGLWGTA